MAYIPSSEGNFGSSLNEQVPGECFLITHPGDFLFHPRVLHLLLGENLFIPIPLSHTLSLLKKNLFRIFNENIQTFSKVKIEQRTLIAPHRGAFAQLSRSCLVCFIPFCFALLQILSFTPVYLNGCGLVTKWCQTLATTWTVACQAPLSMGFPRQEY